MSDLFTPVFTSQQEGTAVSQGQFGAFLLQGVVSVLHRLLLPTHCGVPINLWRAINWPNSEPKQTPSERCQ